MPGDAAHRDPDQIGLDKPGLTGLHARWLRLTRSVTGRSASRFAIVICLLTTSCGGISPGAKGASETMVPIRLSAGPSLIATRQPLCEGLFSYHGVIYHVEIEGCPQSYIGTGRVLGLRWPQAVAGDYRAQSTGERWLNQNGVEIDLTPPIQTSNNSGQLRIHYAGAALPRQP
jgi:hypothetical protein